MAMYVCVYVCYNNTEYIKLYYNNIMTDTHLCICFWVYMIATKGMMGAGEWF